MVTRREIREQDQLMLRRWHELRVAAQYVADALGQIPEVEKVVLFGSAAQPLKREEPRFRKFRRQGIEVLHECHDADLAVWIKDLTLLRSLQDARVSGLKRLLEEKRIGVAHHQVDIFIMEPGADSYVGRLCIFTECPKGKDDCLVPDCGKVQFLRQHKEFAFDVRDIFVKDSVILYDREQATCSSNIEGRISS